MIQHEVLRRAPAGSDRVSSSPLKDLVARHIVTALQQGTAAIPDLIGIRRAGDGVHRILVAGERGVVVVAIEVVEVALIDHPDLNIGTPRAAGPAGRHYLEQVEAGIIGRDLYRRRYLNIALAGIP